LILKELKMFGFINDSEDKEYSTVSVQQKGDSGGVIGSR